MPAGCPRSHVNLPQATRQGDAVGQVEARVDATLHDARRSIGLEDAEHLLLHVAGRSHAWLYAHGDALIEADLLERFHRLVQRRLAGEPVAYLTGRRGFWRLELDVSPDTLIPRPETELLVELALARIGVTVASRVADLGTGSGAIALAIAGERPNAHVLATDASAAALAVAQGNARRLGFHDVEFRRGDWWQPLQGRSFDAILSNPPYIAEEDSHLEQGDLRFEPATALSSGPDGLDALRVITAGAGRHLNPEGWLLVEHGWDQGAAVRALFEDADLTEVRTVRDLSGHERVTLGQAGPHAAG